MQARTQPPIQTLLFLCICKIIGHCFYSALKIYTCDNPGRCCDIVLCFRWQVTWARWHDGPTDIRWYPGGAEVIPGLSLVPGPSAALWLADVMWHQDDPDIADNTVPVVTSLGPQVMLWLTRHDYITESICNKYESFIISTKLVSSKSVPSAVVATPWCCKLPNYFATEWKIICTESSLVVTKIDNWQTPFLVTLHLTAICCYRNKILCKLCYTGSSIITIQKNSLCLWINIYRTFD